MNFPYRSLRIDSTGLPLEWIDFKEAAKIYSVGDVVYTLGDHLYTIRGESMLSQVRESNKH